ncbi:MAG: hypothetical protein IK114_06835 [Fibrobacter sp.]|nr:hypothetical protein [Fibrobacter sp.]
MKKLVFSFLLATMVATAMADDAVAPATAVAPTAHADLSSLVMPQTFTYELRDVDLTLYIDSMSTEETRTIREGEGTSTQNKATREESATRKNASSDAKSSLTEDGRKKNTHFGIGGRAKLQGGNNEGRPTFRFGERYRIRRRRI